MEKYLQRIKIREEDKTSLIEVDLDKIQYLTDTILSSINHHTKESVLIAGMISDYVWKINEKLKENIFTPIKED